MSSSCIKNLLQEVNGEGRHNLHRSEVTDNYWKPGRRRRSSPVTYNVVVKIRWKKEKKKIETSANLADVKFIARRLGDCLPCCTHL